MTEWDECCTQGAYSNPPKSYFWAVTEDCTCKLWVTGEILWSSCSWDSDGKLISVEVWAMGLSLMNIHISFMLPHALDAVFIWRSVVSVDFFKSQYCGLLTSWSTNTAAFTDSLCFWFKQCHEVVSLIQIVFLRMTYVPYVAKVFWKHYHSSYHNNHPWLSYDTPYFQHFISHHVLLNFEGSLVFDTIAQHIVW